MSKETTTNQPAVAPAVAVGPVSARQGLRDVPMTPGLSQASPAQVRSWTERVVGPNGLGRPVSSQPYLRSAATPHSNSSPMPRPVPRSLPALMPGSAQAMTAAARPSVGLPPPGGRVSTTAVLSSSATHAVREASRRVKSDVPTRTVVGQVSEVKVHSPTFATASLILEETFETVKLVGSQAVDLVAGDDYQVVGTTRHHPRWGESLEVVTATPWVRLNEAALVRFIKDNFKGIGDRLASRFVQAVKQEGGSDGLRQLRQRLIHEPWAVDFSLINRDGEYSLSQEDRQKTVTSFIRRDLMLRIDGLGPKTITELSAWAYSKLAAAELSSGGASAANPVARAWRLLQDDPYAPLGAVAGYGFASADAVALEAGIAADDEKRVSALCVAAARAVCDAAGHAYLSRSQLVAAVGELDKASARAFGRPAGAGKPVNEMIALAVNSRLLRLERAQEGAVVPSEGEAGKVSGEGDAQDDASDRLYLPHLQSAERRLAARLAQMISPGPSLLEMVNDKARRIKDAKTRQRLMLPADDMALRAKIQHTARNLGGAFVAGLDASQEQALVNILTSSSRMHTLTAGPGCGKTAVMEVLLKLCSPLSAQLCAPTGKGAKVLTTRVASLGLQANTIHSMLGSDGSNRFEHDASNPLDCELMAIDESSMPDLGLALAAISAVPKGAHVIALGDPGQLPSIGPGRCLSDFLNMQGVDHNRLTTTHRNEGAILDVVKAIGRGTMLLADHPDVRFSHGLPDAAAGFDRVAAQYVQEFRRLGAPHVALLMSRRKPTGGKADEPGWNTTYANMRLREMLNPDGEKVPATTFRVHDRVIIRENIRLSDGERVVNGDTGTISGFRRSPPKAGVAGLAAVGIKLDDGREVFLPAAELSALELGYALTVHAAQGSEYKSVIAVMTAGHAAFVNNNMLYTCVSRAREQLSIWAEDRDLIKIAATPCPARNSHLAQRVAAIQSATERKSLVQHQLLRGSSTQAALASDDADPRDHDRQR